jgi:hypothetical protein
MKRTRYSFRHAGLEEKILAVVIGREFAMEETTAWARYVKLEEVPKFFHDFAQRAAEKAEDFVETILEREKRERESAAADVQSRILRPAPAE